MAHTHRNYSNRYQIELIISAPKVLGADLSEFVKRASQIKETKSLLKKMTDTIKLKKEYFAKITELYTQKMQEMSLEEKPNLNKVQSLLGSYNKLCKAFNKDVFVFERFKEQVSPRLLPRSSEMEF